jgi:hypothetical protein
MLAQRDWTREAACAGTDDPDIWFSEPGSQDRSGLSSPRTLEAFLTCVGCRVRRECLEDSLTTWRVVLPRDGHESGVGIRAVGVWGATTEADRAAVADLPIPEAIARLEAGLPLRVRARVEAFEASRAKAVNRSRRAERAQKMLDEMRGAPSSRASGEDGLEHLVTA